MAAINVSILSTGVGTDTLTGKSDSDGLTIAFENEAPYFVSWKSFKQLLSFKTAQNGGPGKPKEAKPKAEAPAIPAAIPMMAKA
jgi:hypothetical protein